VDYEVRHWRDWHYHQMLSLLATWSLVTETFGKKMDACDDVTADTGRHRGDLVQCVSVRTTLRMRPEQARRLQRNELARLDHWKQHNDWYH
jgi:hypothetical protein